MKSIKKHPEVKDIYKIYNSPTSKVELDERYIYQILFVYKYDKSTDRYLLSNNYRLNDSGEILGWVDGNRVRVWDTAIALEPNWDESSRKERKADSRFIAQVFRSYQDAKAHKNGENVAALLTRDPVDVSLEQYGELIHPSGRYMGDVPRFPYFSQTGGIIECGAIGKVNIANSGAMEGTNEFEYGLLRKELEKREANQNNTSVVFVVDGSTGMNKHLKQTVPDAVERINGLVSPENRNKLKFGLVVYVDGDCGSTKDQLILNQVELSGDIEKFKARSKATPLFTYNDDDDYVAMHYGLSSALEGVGMQRFDNNIIIHIGRSADVSSSITRSMCERRPMIDDEILYQSLFSFRPAIIAMQVDWKKSSKAYKSFELDNRTLMLETTRYINEREKEKFLNISEGESISAEAKAMDGYTEIMNAPSLMRIYLPDRSLDETSIDPATIVNNIDGAFRACLERSKEQIAMIKSLYHDNSKMAEAISEYGEVYSNSLAGINPELLQLLASERVHLFSPAHTYLRHKLAANDSYKYVLFLKQSSVLALKQLFLGIENASDMADDEEKKEYLKNALSKYARSMLNIEDMDNENIDIKDLRRQITGVMDDASISSGNDILSRLSSFDEIDELSNEDVKSLFADLRSRGQKFMAEVYPKGGYPFRYHAGVGDHRTEPELEFYWIPLAYLF
jgi:hypothetical protein